MYKHTLIATGGCDQGIDLGLALVEALEATSDIVAVLQTCAESNVVF
jgi:hypothetical protein